LGRCTVFLHEASTNNLKPDPKQKAKEEEENNNMVPKPKWHDIRMGFDDKLPATGQILCSFVVVR